MSGPFLSFSADSSILRAIQAGKIGFRINFARGSHVWIFSVLFLFSSPADIFSFTLHLKGFAEYPDPTLSISIDNDSHTFVGENNGSLEPTLEEAKDWELIAELTETSTANPANASHWRVRVESDNSFRMKGPGTSGSFFIPYKMKVAWVEQSSTSGPQNLRQTVESGEKLFPPDSSSPEDYFTKPYGNLHEMKRDVSVQLQPYTHAPPGNYTDTIRFIISSLL